MPTGAKLGHIVSAETDRMNLSGSLNCYEAAKAIGGRSLTRSKAPGRLFEVGAGPMYAASGDGAILTDVDGNRYIDMLCALGAISLGYGRESEWVDINCDRSAAREMRRGWIYSLPSYLEGQAAEAMLSTFAPWASQVRFVKTGSESTHAAYRIAKRATGREHVLVGDWAYHGWHEWSDKNDSGNSARFYPHGMLMSEIAWDPTRVAAVFIEPHRWEPVNVEWLTSVREWCDRHGVLLVFDEMIYGGRWAKGGATEFFGVRPDLACFGKAIGNGAPIACVVGNEALADHGELVSGTYSGETASLAALIDVARAYDTKPVIDTLWKRGQQLARGLREAISQYPGAVLEGQPVHQRVRFANPEHGKLFAAAMAQRGVLWHPDVVNVSFSHAEAHIERVVEGAIASLAEMAKATT